MLVFAVLMVVASVSMIIKTKENVCNDKRERIQFWLDKGVDSVAELSQLARCPLTFARACKKEYQIIQTIPKIHSKAELRERKTKFVTDFMTDRDEPFPNYL